MNRPFKILLFLSFITFLPPLGALEPLIDGAWLKAHLGDKGLVILDIQPPAYYQRYHVPGAVNAPYGLWRTDGKTGRPGMRPPVARMEEILGGLGIGNDATVVIVATGMGPGDMAAAGRVFWSLKTVGLERLAVLNGGLAAYANRFKGALESKAAHREPATFKAHPTQALSAGTATVQAALKAKTPLLDARTLGEYTGVLTGGRGERGGTIPGARHLPFDWLVGPDGTIRPRDQIVTLFRARGLDPERDGTIHFCHTGNRAALSWFVDYAVLGHKSAKLYDGSMSEWAADARLPIETRIKL